MSEPNCVSNKPERSDEPHPDAVKIARAAEKLKPLHQCAPEEARTMRKERGNPYAPLACVMAAVEDISIAAGEVALPARIYRPTATGKNLQPALIYYHGGGYVLGDIDQYDTVAQQLAATSGCVVISVDYRLAPEVKSAQIYAESFAAYCWIYDNSSKLGIDRQRLAIGGDSAGGNLTIAVALSCKQKQQPMPAFQLLIYPATDYSMSFASIDEFASGYFLTRDNMIWFREHFLENQERIDDPQVSPMLADLTGLPPAYVLTAGFDPLRDEGFAFAQRLAEQGVQVEHVCYTDMIHAFISFAGGIPAGMAALQQMGAVLKNKLRP